MYLIERTLNMAVTVSNTYSLSMIYAGFKRVGTWWNYKNVISPFYRLYYIEKGNGKVYINNTLIPQHN